MDNKKLERCELTIDLEEIIAMKKDEENEFTHVRAEVLWNSGRVELFSSRLLKGNAPPAKFRKKISDLKKFPTVQSVKTERYNEDT